MSIVDDIGKGKEALGYFHNQALKYPDYDLSFEELINKVGGGPKKSPIFLEGLGFAVNQIGNQYLAPSKLRASMEELADKGAGKIPANSSAFFSAISGQAQSISWIDAIPVIAADTAVAAVNELAGVGSGILNSVRAVSFILPVLVVGALVYFVSEKTRKYAK